MMQSKNVTASIIPRNAHRSLFRLGKIIVPVINFFHIK